MKNDKDSVILKFQQEVASDIEVDVENLAIKNENQDLQLQELQARLQKLNGGKKFTVKTQKTKFISLGSGKKDAKRTLNYDELYALAEQNLSERGLNIDELNYNDLVSDDELAEITKQLNMELPRDEKWAKSDFIVMFIAAFLGCAADIILSNRDNQFTGNKSNFSKKLNELHEKTFKHKTGAPIDYQGKDFGGGHHRVLSKGHDLLRFVEGIKMFKEGQFEGVRVVNNQVINVVSNLNQYGNPYNQLTTIEAIINYAGHMFADLFSTYSLPFPGYSFFRASSNREIRLLAVDMYKNGFNLKNVVTQSLSCLIVEFVIRLFYSIQSVQRYANELEIDENYSNIEAIKKFVNPQKKDKLYEMILTAHGIVAAQNVGKISFRCIASNGLDAKALAELNIAEIIAVVKYGSIVINSAAKRNDAGVKAIYHSECVHEKWAVLDEALKNSQDFDSVSELSKLVI